MRPDDPPSGGCTVFIALKGQLEALEPEDFPVFIFGHEAVDSSRIFDVVCSRETDVARPGSLLRCDKLSKNRAYAFGIGA